VSAPLPAARGAALHLLRQNQPSLVWAPPRADAACAPSARRAQLRQPWVGPPAGLRCPHPYPPPLPALRSDYQAKLAGAEKRVAELEAARWVARGEAGKGRGGGAPRNRKPRDCERRCGPGAPLTRCIPSHVSPHPSAAAEERAGAVSAELESARAGAASAASASAASEAALASKVADAERELAALRAASRAAEMELVAKQKDVAGALDAASGELQAAKSQLAAAVGRAEQEAAAREEAGRRLAAVRCSRARGPCRGARGRCGPLRWRSARALRAPASPPRACHPF
jgi:hypothetical protein